MCVGFCFVVFSSGDHSNVPLEKTMKINMFESPSSVFQLIHVIFPFARS